MPFTPGEKSIALSLAAQVKETFPNPTWPADLEASQVGGLEGQYINEHFPGKKWTEITDEELGWTGQDSWAFTDEALAFFLPAWLVSYLEEHYPGAENFGAINFPDWMRRLTPFRNHNYSPEQIQILHQIAKFNIDLCGDLAYCKDDIEALALLEKELGLSNS